MEPDDSDHHLSRMTTLWTLVKQAHEAGPGQARSAQEQMLNRYGSAIRRYLQAALGRSDAVEELFQQFAHNFVSGGLRGADPHRGRFRDYVKTSLFHLIANYHRERHRQPLQLGSKAPEPAVDPSSELTADREFLASWRKELLARAWTALAALEESTGQPFHTVLRFQAEHSELRSPVMAAELSRQLAKPVSAAGLRQTLHRARKKFAALLLDEVRQALENPTEDELYQELIDLEIFRYCQDALPGAGQQT